MGQEFSFDVVSKVDPQAVDNAVNSVMREIGTRFDFKGSISKVEFDRKENLLTLHADDETRLKNVIDILQGRLVKQGVSLKALDFQTLEQALGGTVRQKAKLTQGVASDKAKEMVRALKDAKIKVQASIQGEQVRVTGKSKDDLQAAIAFLRGKDFGIPLQFSNYR